MKPLDQQQIRAAMANSTRGESSRMVFPAGFAGLEFSDLEYLGWRDPKAPQRGYLVSWRGDRPVGIALRAPEDAAKRRRAVCAWCEDVYATDEVSLNVARRAGASGRNGDTLGTLICTTFGCSRNVRRIPRIVEAGDDPDGLVLRRIDGLRERSVRFAEDVLRGA